MRVDSHVFYRLYSNSYVRATGALSQMLMQRREWFGATGDMFRLGLKATIRNKCNDIILFTLIMIMGIKQCTVYLKVNNCVLFSDVMPLSDLDAWGGET